MGRSVWRMLRELELHKRRGCTLLQFAAQLGVSPRDLSCFERGYVRRSCDLRVLLAYLAADCSLGEQEREPAVRSRQFVSEVTDLASWQAANPGVLRYIRGRRPLARFSERTGLTVQQLRELEAGASGVPLSALAPYAELDTSGLSPAQELVGKLEALGAWTREWVELLARSGSVLRRARGREGVVPFARRAGVRRSIVRYIENGQLFHSMDAYRHQFVKALWAYAGK